MDTWGLMANEAKRRRQGITTRHFTEGPTFLDLGSIPAEPAKGFLVPDMVPLLSADVPERTPGQGGSRALLESFWCFDPPASYLLPALLNIHSR